MRKFKCIVTTTKEYIVELDENVFTEEYMREFRDVFYNFDTLQEHAEHLARCQALFENESFIEGYGHVLVNGKMKFSFESGREHFVGANIIEESDDIDVESKEIE